VESGVAEGSSSTWIYVNIYILSLVKTSKHPDAHTQQKEVAEDQKGLRGEADEVCTVTARREGRKSGLTTLEAGLCSDLGCCCGRC